MARSPKKMPEVDLPPLFSTVFVAYLGSRAMSKLTMYQRQAIMTIIQQTANSIGEVLITQEKTNNSMSHEAYRKAMIDNIGE